MCMLSFYPKDVMPNREHLRRGSLKNRDGHGYAIVAGKQLITGHSMNATQAIDDFMRLREQFPHGPALFHSRISTGGHVTTYNCHPFYVGTGKYDWENGEPAAILSDKTVIAHNGILWFQSEKEKRSDTREFAEDYFPTYFRRLNRPTVPVAMEKFIGTSNKMVILTVDRRYRQNAYLFNASSGHWVSPEGDYKKGKPWESAWHSNRDYTEPTHYTYTSPKKDKVFKYEKQADGTYILVEDKDSKSSTSGSPPFKAGGNTTVTSGNSANGAPFRPVECEICFSFTVDSYTLLCDSCGHCAWCLKHRSECKCGSWEEKDMVPQAITAGKDVKAIEAAFADRAKNVGVAQSPDYVNTWPSKVDLLADDTIKACACESMWDEHLNGTSECRQCGARWATDPNAKFPWGGENP